MTDDLPEIFDRLDTPQPPAELRARVLAAVDRELTRRRKPRWERALELGVAASFVLGVGLNVWQVSAEPLGPTPSLAVANEEPASLIEQLAADEQVVDGRGTMTRRRVPGPFDAQYAELLQELLDTKAG
jgi:hypothetical protein